MIWYIRHPSVSTDYGNVLWMEDLEQCLVWLRRPIREWQSVPHWGQIQCVSRPAPWFCCFCDLLFASACWTRDSSKWERPWCNSCLQAERSDVKVVHLLRSITKAFRSRLQISLYRTCGLPLWGAFPALILHTGDLLESDCQPSRHAQADKDTAHNKHIYTITLFVIVTSSQSPFSAVLFFALVEIIYTLVSLFHC